MVPAVSEAPARKGHLQVPRIGDRRRRWRPRPCALAADRAAPAARSQLIAGKYAGLHRGVFGAIPVGPFGKASAARTGKFGPDLGGIRKLQFIQDGQRELPCLPGLRQVAGGLLNVTEMRKDIGFVEAVP
jgi:hypothetical protein